MASTDISNAPSLDAVRGRLVDHPLYAALTNRERVRIFMKHHVFAVWDFFSLLKRLQREVTCVEVPWSPRGLGDHARFITEIVLAEEADEGPSGGHLSHFELYLDAMAELEADTGPIHRYLARLAGGESAINALESPDVPATVSEFVSHTITVATAGDLHEVAASFCHGRENLLPDVLGGARDGMQVVLDEAPIFKHYLERHITLDHDEHGPLALRLLDAACAGDPGRERRAITVGIEAIVARSKLWDGVLAEINASGH